MQKRKIKKEEIIWNSFSKIFVTKLSKQTNSRKKFLRILWMLIIKTFYFAFAVTIY